jgi:hypothetical protein
MSIKYLWITFSIAIHQKIYTCDEIYFDSIFHREDDSQFQSEFQAEKKITDNTLYLWLTTQYQVRNKNLQLMYSDPEQPIITFNLGTNSEKIILSKWLDTLPSWLKYIINIRTTEFSNKVFLIPYKKDTAIAPDIAITSDIEEPFVYIKKWEQNNTIRTSLLQCHLNNGTTYSYTQHWQRSSEILFHALFVHIVYRIYILKNNFNDISAQSCEIAIDQSWINLLEGNEFALNFLKSYNIYLKEKTDISDLPIKPAPDLKAEGLEGQDARQDDTHSSSALKDIAFSGGDNKKNKKELENLSPFIFYKSWKCIIPTIGILLILITFFITKK